MVRRGFTLIEMLVATGVFILGFVAVFGLFLAGMRFRKLSEDTTRASLAASSLVAEMRIDAGNDGTGVPQEPVLYLGDGVVGTADDGTATGTLADTLTAYLAQPGMWYRVMSCTSLDGLATGPAAAQSTALRVTLLVVPWATTASDLAFSEVNQRLRLGIADGPSAAQLVADELVRTGAGLRCEAVIVRRASWLPVVP